MHRMVFLFLLSLQGMAWAEPAALNPATLDAASHATRAGLYRITLHPPVPIHLNQYQTWGVYVEDAAGLVVDNARVELSADMPAHGHGLLASPQVSAGSAPGRYRVEGLRFHMPGHWEIKVQVSRAGKHDELVLPIELE